MNDVAKAALNAAMTPSEVLAAIVITQLLLGAVLWFLGQRFATKKHVGALHTRIDNVATAANTRIDGVAAKAAEDARLVAEVAREKRHNLAAHAAKEIARVCDEGAEERAKLETRLGGRIEQAQAIAYEANHKQSLLDQALVRMGKDIGDIKSMLQEKLTVQGQHSERIAVLESRSKRSRGGSGR